MQKTYRLIAVAALVFLAARSHAANPGVPIANTLRRPTQPRLNISLEDTVGPKLVLPIVGSAAGQNNTFFKSAVTLMNYRGFGVGTTLVPQRIKVEYYPAGSSGVGVTPVFYTLRNLGEYWDNFINDFFIPAKSGLGALVITAVDANGTLDPNGLLDAVTRIYTAQPSSAGCVTPGGSVSQALSALEYEDLENPSETGYIFGLRQDAKYRTNIGIVNHDTKAHTFNVHIIKFNGGADVEFTITVQPKSLTQAPIPAGDYGPSMVVELYSTDNDTFFYNAYGSSTDNATGDGWIYKASF